MPTAPVFDTKGALCSSPRLTCLIHIKHPLQMSVEGHVFICSLEPCLSHETLGVKQHVQFSRD